MNAPEEQNPPSSTLGPRPSVDPLVAIVDVLVWIACGIFVLAVAASYLIAVN